MKDKYSIGIGLNLFDARVILLRGDGKVVAQAEKKREKVSANETIKILLELFESVLPKAKKYKDKLLGAGLALGGIVNSKKGVVFWPQEEQGAYAYVSLPLKEYLEKKFGFPIVLENDANACVLAEYLNNFPKNKNILYMFSGVGCGMIVDGKLYKGKEGSAGELFLNSQKKSVMSSRLGDFSFLKQWPIDLGMVKRAKELISLGRDTSLIRRVSSTGELSLKDIFDEAKKKDKGAREVIKEGGFCLGVKISFLVNLLSPEVIIIGGGLEEAGEVFLEECINTVKKFSLSDIRKNTKICLSQLGKRATSLGAALNVFHG